VRRDCPRRWHNGSAWDAELHFLDCSNFGIAKRACALYSKFVHEEPHIEIPQPEAERTQFGFALGVAAAAVVIVLAAFYLWPGRQSPSRGGAQEVHPPFGPAERAYAAKIQFENFALSRAENFLNQEVTTLAGELINAGDQTLSEIEVTVEFSDQLDQVALRETRLAVTSASPPVTPTERRSFEVSFEHIPTSWNSQLPVVRVSGLRFGPEK